MRQVIGLVIYEAQSTLVKGHQIIDGIFLANELEDDARKLKKKS